jgi:glycosyltransferase involved in cell wall biosynthesis
MKLIAFYLPQFHPIAENDAWWGTGFTEWRNVAAARPRFRGHTQPRLPGELGFYDLRVAETRMAQAELARAHGIDAFCYYHYWFEGRRLLERPFEEVRAAGEPDLPFCLCWANESWTRAWSDREGQVLIEQRYSESDDLAHARYLADTFTDPRYLRIEGRPLLLVYRAAALPDPRRTSAHIRREALQRGVGDPLLCRVESDPWLERRLAPAEIGFDAAVEFSPDWLDLDPERGARHRTTRTGDRIYDYAGVVERSLARLEPAYPTFRCVTPGWDNTPRRRTGAVLLGGSTPALYRRWLEALIARAAERPTGQQLIFVNAWNEWAEGAYLEPDTILGRGYLEATRDARVAGETRNARAGAERIPESPPRRPSQEMLSPGGARYRIAVPASLEEAAAGGTRPGDLNDPIDSADPTSQVDPADSGRVADAGLVPATDRLGERMSLATRLARARVRAAVWRYERRADRARGRENCREGAGYRPPDPLRRGRFLPSRPSVLVVSPYPVYPPISGGSVRIWNLLRHVGVEFDLHLAVFSTTRDDAGQRQELERFCRSVHFLRREEAPPPDPSSLLPRGAEYFAFARARRRLRDLAESCGAEIVQLEHTELGQFTRLFPGKRVVLTELDLSFVTASRRRELGFERRFAADRELWGDEYALRRLMRYEIGSAESADQVHVMSELDAETLGRYLRDGRRRIRVVDNGVDCDRFKPRTAGPAAAPVVLFVGSFGHTPNRDAIGWLFSEIWPRVRAQRPDARLQVVGAHAPAEILAADGRDGIEVVGTVPDTAAYYRDARVLLAPVRAGSGTRLKILEAFASGLPVVTTSLGAEGIAAQDGEHLLTAESAQELAAATCRVLADDLLARRLGESARALAERRYDWRGSAEKLMSSWNELLRAGAEDAVHSTRTELPIAAAAAPAGDTRRSVRSVAAVDAVDAVEVSIVIPTKNGGKRLDETLAQIGRQYIDVPFEVVCIDSGSSAEELARMRAHGARVESIPPESFNHGLTRDIGARLARGRVLVFLNQDAVPVDSLWLHRMTAPLLRPGRFAAVQGGIRELPSREDVFYWHSCGPRFYFTSESSSWIASHGGIGFSTVNAALRREAWEALPFGWAPILEDKKWQAAALESGLLILDLPEAAVFHSHTYDLVTLWRRAASEGFGWRLVGVRYPPAKMMRDLVHRQTLEHWFAGLVQGDLASGAERLFPWVRPLALYWGNRWARDVAL